MDKQEIIEGEIGKTYGRLTITKFIGKNKHGQYIYEATCLCGAIKNYRRASLKSGETKSCGCYQKEVMGQKSKKHGVSHTSEYMTWYNMKRRCSDMSEKWHAQAGVKVCARWLESFQNFYADMGPKPTPKHTLDRYPNQRGDYEPGNCRWATWDQQAHNRTSNVWLTANGMTKTQKQWGEYFGVLGCNIADQMAKGLSFQQVFELYKERDNAISNGINRKRIRRGSAGRHKELPRLE